MPGCMHTHHACCWIEGPAFTLLSDGIWTLLVPFAPVYMYLISVDYSWCCVRWDEKLFLWDLHTTCVACKRSWSIDAYACLNCLSRFCCMLQVFQWFFSRTLKLWYWSILWILQASHKSPGRSSSARTAAASNIRTNVFIWPAASLQAVPPAGQRAKLPRIQCPRVVVGFMGFIFGTYIFIYILLGAGMEDHIYIPWETIPRCLNAVPRSN